MSTALSKSDQNALQRHLEAIDDAKGDMVRGAVTIGQELIAMQELIPKSEFIDRVEKECGFSRTATYRYIEVAKVFGKFPRIENFQDSALYVLVKSEAAAKKAKDMASRGRRITHEMALDIVREVKSEPVSSPKVGTDRIQVIDVKAVPAQEIPETDSAEPEPEPAPEPDEPPAGGYEPEEAKKPITKLAKCLAEAARNCADLRKMFPDSAEVKACYAGIDAATKSLTTFRGKFAKRAK